jgi:hypothetical protein
MVSLRLLLLRLSLSSPASEAAAIERLGFSGGRTLPEAVRRRP